MENKMKCILEKYKPPIIAAFGNPLLDMCTTISDSNILDRYGLVPNGQKEVSDGDLKIFSDIRNSFTVEYHPGGAAQNTLRIFQWLISYPLYSVFFGAVGNDDEGKLIEKLVKNSGVETRYKYHDDYPTGSCLALINGENRSLIGHLGAANMYEPSDLLQHMQILDQVNIIYIESFFISHSYDVALILLKLCQDKKIALVFNIGAIYMCTDFSSEVSHLAINANILFGNKEEFKALGKVMNLECGSTYSIALALHSRSNHRAHFDNTCELGQYLNKMGKIIVVTDGKDPVMCVYGSACNKPSVIKFNVPFVNQERIKDTTGAGDSFIAGFLAGVFIQHSLETCLAWGCWTAQQVIQLVGCQVPPYPSHGIDKIKY